MSSWPTDSSVPCTAFDPEGILAKLEQGIGHFLDRWSRAPGTHLVSLTLPLDPMVPLLPVTSLGSHRFLSSPGEDKAMLGVGTAARLRTSGPGRFSAMAEFLGRTRQNWPHHDPEHTGLGPRAFIGFAFDAAKGPVIGSDVLPNAEAGIPLVLLQRKGARSTMTFTGRADTDLGRTWIKAAATVLEALSCIPDTPQGPSELLRTAANPDDPVWLARAARAVSHIRAGRMEKVVLTRRIRVVANHDLEPAHIVQRLRDRHANCTLFAVSDGTGVTAVGATPERLVSLEGRRVRSDALAGTLARPQDDRSDPFGAHLLTSEKNSHEHQLVVQAVLAALTPVCEELCHPEQPRLLHQSAMRHLWTPITGLAEPGVTLMDLVARLHPTPAVGGSPHRVAMDWLARDAEHRLGWYTGGVGWVSPEGDGEVSVVLRCATIVGNTATLSAGAGIVAESRPEMELEETELKLGPMLEALEGA